MLLVVEVRALQLCDARDEVVGPLQLLLPLLGGLRDARGARGEVHRALLVLARAGQLQVGLVKKSIETILCLKFSKMFKKIYTSICIEVRKICV